MISTLFRFMLKNALPLLAAASLLAACSPEHNWRELDVADGRVRAAFPARVQTETRELALGGKTLRFSLTAAEVNQAVYAVGYAPLPASVAGDAAASQALAGALVQSLYANLGADAPDTLPAMGQDIEVHGQAANAGARSWMLARVWVANGMLIEAVAAGAENKLAPERAREFMNGVRVHR
ncbi:Uncharacterised protein [Bordetella ansorpii]|uniref:Lipoprotein n=1 Tax=Bordetella ansorpii TaxID=288768 RepID=A0A157SJI9_9BORD|nr:hypothetical protein [Bordetella ansorpii]SAI70421.1 Uncharacterised protein [Bordetella ansorpii]